MFHELKVQMGIQAKQILVNKIKVSLQLMFNWSSK